MITIYNKRIVCYNIHKNMHIGGLFMLGENTKGRFGFGCMRLPMKDGEVDHVVFSEMVDCFISAGLNYFDTAHGYIDGKSETAIRECLTSRYPRDAYVLTNKLSGHHFNKKEDIRPLFESQLEATGVDYFDYYLMHAQSAANYRKYKECEAYEVALELKREGKIRHLGISLHDTYDVLRRILTENPEIEVVQIQFNYADYGDAYMQSKENYETCLEFGKKIIVMEPVKGGSLVNLPEDARAIFDSLGSDCSYAGYALRFVGGFEGVDMILSGMGDMDMMRDNLKNMNPPMPLSAEELDAVYKVKAVFNSMGLIGCTACGYCTEQCPRGIAIPGIFACVNGKKVFNSWSCDYYYSLLVKEGKGADRCIDCGLCEAACPQHLPVRELLKTSRESLEKQK